LPNAPLVSLGYFTGLNTVDDPLRFTYRVIDTPAGKKAGYPALKLDNLDIDNAWGLSSRSGYDKQLACTSAHSLFAVDDTCLYVDASSLYELAATFDSSTLLKSGLATGARMSYALVNDRIYLTNGSYIGYYKQSAVHDLPVPVANYKVSLPPGQRIAYYRGLLFVASGKILYISDALCDHYDIRTGYRVFANNITMVRPVDKGVFVSDGDTYFLAEGENFRRDWVLDIDCIPHTDIRINGKDIKDGADSNYAMWTSTKGICLGTPDGQIRNLTAAQYAMASHGIGGAVLRDNNGIKHYLAVLE
jgi:hypothetical protein